MNMKNIELSKANVLDLQYYDKIVRGWMLDDQKFIPRGDLEHCYKEYSELFELLLAWLKVNCVHEPSNNTTSNTTPTSNTNTGCEDPFDKFSAYSYDVFSHQSNGDTAAIVTNVVAPWNDGPRMERFIRTMQSVHTNTRVVVFMPGASVDGGRYLQDKFTVVHTRDDLERAYLSDTHVIRLLLVVVSSDENALSTVGYIWDSWHIFFGTLCNIVVMPDTAVKDVRFVHQSFVDQHDGGLCHRKVLTYSEELWRRISFNSEGEHDVVPEVVRCTLQALEGTDSTEAFAGCFVGIVEAFERAGDTLKVKLQEKINSSIRTDSDISLPDLPIGQVVESEEAIRYVCTSDDDTDSLLPSSVSSFNPPLMELSRDVFFDKLTHGTNSCGAVKLEADIGFAHTILCVAKELGGSDWQKHVFAICDKSRYNFGVCDAVVMIDDIRMMDELNGKVISGNVYTVVFDATYFDVNAVVKFGEWWSRAMMIGGSVNVIIATDTIDTSIAAFVKGSTKQHFTHSSPFFTISLP